MTQLDIDIAILDDVLIRNGLANVPLSQHQIADICGVKRQDIWNIERAAKNKVKHLLPKSWLDESHEENFGEVQQ